MDAWQNLIEGNFVISEEFQGKIKSLMARSDATTPQQYIVNRAQKALEEAKK